MKWSLCQSNYTSGDQIHGLEEINHEYLWDDLGQPRDTGREDGANELQILVLTVCSLCETRLWEKLNSDTQYKGEETIFWAEEDKRHFGDWNQVTLLPVLPVQKAKQEGSRVTVGVYATTWEFVPKHQNLQTHENTIPSTKQTNQENKNPLKAKLQLWDFFFIAV